MVPNVRDIAKLPIDRLPRQVRVEPVTSAAEVTIRPPGSKSLTNRALLLAALAEGTSTLTGALVEADDAQVMIRALRQLGAEIEITPETHDGEPSGNATLRVRGVAGRWKLAKGQSVTLNLNNAGTATRFLTAAAILQPPDAGGIVIDGNERMRQRPIGELVDALNALTERGPRVGYVGVEGFPPVMVPSMAIDWISGMGQAFGRTSSSQFISALLLVAPFLPSGLEIAFVEPPTSKSYIEMTLSMLRSLGVEVRGDIAKGVRVAGGGLAGFTLAIEPDASGATYFMAAQRLIAGSRISLPGLDARASVQGDAAFASLAATFGPSGGACDIDLTLMPDAAMTAAVLACFADGTSTLRGLRTLRVKETDRIAAMVTELGKVGVVVEPFAYVDPLGQQDEGIRITPPMLNSGTRGIDCSRGVPEVVFHTYDDHRMAMSLALIGLRRPNVVIDDPACVRKTYPTFWRDLAKVYG